MTKKFIMMVGLPGTGKSTWIRSFLKNNPDFAVISSDDIIQEKADEHGLSYQEGFEKYSKFAMNEMNRRAKAAFESNKDVIWDQTNLNAKTRKGKLAMAENFSSETYVKEAVVFSLDNVEHKRRINERKQTTGKEVPDWVIDNMARSYQAPTKDEGFSKIQFIKS